MVDAEERSRPKAKIRDEVTAVRNDREMLLHFGMGVPKETVTGFTCLRQAAFAFEELLDPLRESLVKRHPPRTR